VPSTTYRKPCSRPRLPGDNPHHGDRANLRSTSAINAPPQNTAGTAMAFHMFHARHAVWLSSYGSEPTPPKQAHEAPGRAK
jgi:hypothetical protein